MAGFIALAVKYWPTAVAGLGLAYAVAAGNADAVGPAVAALVATLGLNSSGVSAHAKIDAVRDGGA